MHEWNPVERGHGEHPHLDKRLSAYYGPELQEQPLPESSWLRVRTRLGPQRSSKRQRLWRWHTIRHPRLRPRGRRVHRRPIPANIRDAFSRLVGETRQAHPVPSLRCSFTSRRRAPAVRVSPIGGRSIRLILPVDGAWALEPSELDVLLATGMARRLYTRKPAPLLLQLLLVSVVLFAGAALILFGTHRASLLPFLIAIAFCIVISGLMHVQGRRLAFQADDQVVQWLGRSRACQGLHVLASRTGSRRRGRWGEPSLLERIDRVCGTRVTAESERLTLVR